MLDITYYETQLARMSLGQPAQPDMSAWAAALTTLGRVGRAAFLPRRA